MFVSCYAVSNEDWTVYKNFQIVIHQPVGLLKLAH